MGKQKYSKKIVKDGEVEIDRQASRQGIVNFLDLIMGKLFWVLLYWDVSP